MTDLAASSAKLRLAKDVLFLVAAMFGMLVGGTLLHLLLFDRAPPIVYGGFSVADVTGRQTTQFRAGDIIVLTREFCAQGENTVVIDRRFVGPDSSTSYAVPSAAVILPRGCVRSARAVQIPSYMPPGRYRFEAVVSYSNNLFVSGIVRAPVPVIEIVP